MRPLLVIISDRLSDLVKKGEVTDRYYNPGNLFCDVHILMANTDQPQASAVQKMVGRARLHLHNLPPPSFTGTLGWQTFLLAPWLRAGHRLASRIQPGLIRCHGLHLHTYLAARIKTSLGIPAVLSLHGNPDVDYGRLVRMPHRRLAYMRWKSLGERGLRSFDHIIAVYSPIRSYLEARHLTNSSIIYNTVGMGALRKTSYEIPDGTVRCICVGRQQRLQKDPRPIVRAIAGIDNAFLSLYGNGDLHQELIGLAKALKIQHRVVFSTGVPNQELLRELHTFDMYVYNSINYEISKTVMEAALVGLPIIHNVRTPALAEELQGDYIFRVENSAEGYRHGILALMRDTGLRKRLGEQARAYAGQYWAPEMTEGQVVSLYTSLLGSSP